MKPPPPVYDCWRQCPVCWRRIRSTSYQCIELHWDTAHRDICPGSQEPYRITIISEAWEMTA